MNRARVAAAFRELADAIEEETPEREDATADDPGLTLTEAGVVLGSKAHPVHPSTVSRMVKGKLLKAIPCGKTGYRILLSSILELKKKGAGGFPRRVAIVMLAGLLWSCDPPVLSTYVIRRGDVEAWRGHADYISTSSKVGMACIEARLGWDVEASVCGSDVSVEKVRP